MNPIFKFYIFICSCAGSPLLCGLSLVKVGGGCSLSQCTGFSWRLLLLGAQAVVGSRA